MAKKYGDIVKTLPHSMEVVVGDRVLPTLEEAVAHINGMDFNLIKTNLCRVIGCCVGSGCL
ncbi:hypothetical protein [Pseudomonas sp. ML2-2023-6]|uniref:hypothetical protein n=1 Tax=Pseudomonas sp. ML2-2023-6 TaxID=3122376 RepID=UPI0030CFFCF5